MPTSDQAGDEVEAKLCRTSPVVTPKQPPTSSDISTKQPPTSSDISTKQPPTSTEVMPKHAPTSTDVTPRRALTLANVNPRLRDITYGPQQVMFRRAGEIERELAAGIEKPFEELIKTNVGDCQGMGQTPITFVRQVVALLTCPALLTDPRFPADACARARATLSCCAGGSVGAYTPLHGLNVVRERVAQFVQRRDGGVACRSDDVVLTAGTADAIKSVMKLLIGGGEGEGEEGERPGVMVPVPIYPLYSATVGEYGVSLIRYYLDEENEWGTSVDELRRAVNEARTRCDPRAIVVVNPGNPTSQVLTESDMQDLVRFAYDEQLLILADEVYQENVYAEDRKFHSFKKVVSQMEFPYNQTQLASFMSCSKGFMTECGFRGGYVELFNFPPEVRALYLRLRTAEPCPSTLGQAVLECMVNPPLPGDPSYPLFAAECSRVLASLAARALAVHAGLNAVTGVTCAPIRGSLYAFPRIEIPAGAVEAAGRAGVEPDLFYALRLLERTGVVVVPGCGFEQRPGTYHLRTTILPPAEKLAVMLDKFRAFHEQFTEEYK